MKVEVCIGALIRQIEIRGTGTNLSVVAGKGQGQIDALEVAPNTYSIIVNGRAFEVTVTAAADGALVCCAGREYPVAINDPRTWRRERATLSGPDGQQQVTAPMPGKVVRILVSAGDAVEAEQGLMVVEAMKMQNEIRASRGGTVERILVREGQAVAAGEALLAIH